MKHIFIVDDEIPILEWLTMCVQDFDPTIEVGAFCNGEEAMAAMVSHVPDLIITDVAMPKMNGIELLEAIAHHHYPIDVIMMSGHQDFEYARASLKFGATDYILKSEINKECIFSLLEKVRKNTARKSQAAPDGSDMIQTQAMKTAYLKKILSDDIPCTLDNLRQNGILLEDGPFFVVALSNNKEAIRTLDTQVLTNIGQREWIQLESTVVFAANTVDEDHETPERFIGNLRQCLGGRVNIGYSALHLSIKDFKKAIQQAMNMRDCAFFKVGRGEACTLRSEKELKKINLRLFELYSDIINQYKVCGPDNLHTGVDRFMQFIKELKHYDVDYIKLTTCRMLEGIYHNIESNAMYIEKEKREIYGATNLRELENAVFAFCDRIPHRHHYSESIERAIAYLHAQYHQPIALSDVANHIHLSDEYFSRLFRKEVGKTFTDYLNAFRMQEAMRLLKSTNQRVADICEAVGISNPKYFSLLFKKYFNVSPSQARENPASPSMGDCILNKVHHHLRE